jgi:outer membrane murein-binding lipoprotein Lpp
MSHNISPMRRLACARSMLPAVVVMALVTAGCASMAEDVDAYYRQMAYNYREAGEKAKMDELSLESESKVLAATGDFRQRKRTVRELDKVKSWETKCEKEAGRFEKAAKWTEAHFHLSRPAIPDGPPGTGKSEDEAVLQASGSKTP